MLTIAAIMVVSLTFSISAVCATVFVMWLLDALLYVFAWLYDGIGYTVSLFRSHQPQRRRRLWHQSTD
jgi:hypothetical protein